MQTDRQQIINASARLARRFRESRIGHIWVRLKFWELLWACPPWRVTKYQRDLSTIKCVRRTLRDARRKENKGKTAIFRAMDEGVILSEDELKTIDLKVALKIFARLETFLAIYRLEIDLARSVIPYVEVTDDLDSVIGKFESEGETLLPVVEQLCRKRQRRDIEAFTSGILALLVLVLYILASSVDLAAWATYAVTAGLFFILVWIIPVTAIGIWRSFPPILRVNETAPHS